MCARARVRACVRVGGWVGGWVWLCVAGGDGGGGRFLVGDFNFRLDLHGLIRAHPDDVRVSAR